MKGAGMSRYADRKVGGVALGGIVAVVGLVVALWISLLVGVILIVVGLVPLGGFAKGKWY
jgi:type IV secretory pathway TrbD component